MNESSDNLSRVLNILQDLRATLVGFCEIVEKYPEKYDANEIQLLGDAMHEVDRVIRITRITV